MVMETGDATYGERLERYNYVMARLAEKPAPTQTQIGKELGISRQNVNRLIKRGGVKPSGRPRSNAGRRARLIERLAKWQDRRNARLLRGIDVAREDRWIASLEADIAKLA